MASVNEFEVQLDKSGNAPRSLNMVLTHILDEVWSYSGKSVKSEVIITNDPNNKSTSNVSSSINDEAVFKRFLVIEEINYEEEFGNLGEYEEENAHLDATATNTQYFNQSESFESAANLVLPIQFN